MSEKKFQIKDTRKGTGKEVTGGDYIVIHYLGTLVNGKNLIALMTGENHLKPELVSGR